MVNIVFEFITNCAVILHDGKRIVKGKNSAFPKLPPRAFLGPCFRQFGKEALYFGGQISRPVAIFQAAYLRRKMLQFVHRRMQPDQGQCFAFGHRISITAWMNSFARGALIALPAPRSKPTRPGSLAAKGKISG